jgi:predicted MFS family arabinose efflux permease
MRNTGPSYKWAMLALLFCVGGLNYCDRVALAAVFPLIRIDLKMGDIGLGAVGSVFLWSYALASPLAGLLADRVSRSRMIVWTLTGWSLITLVTGLAVTEQQLLFTRVLLGFVEAAYLPAAMALIADYHSSSTRGTAIGIHTAGLTFGLVAGGAISGYLGEHFGWRLGFFALGTAGLGLAATAALVLRDAPVAPAGRRDPVAALPLRVRLGLIFRTPSFLLIIPAGMSMAIGNNIFMNWLPLYFYDTYGMSLARAGFAGTFAMQGMAVLALILGGMFSDRVAGAKTWRRMAIQMVCLTIATPFLFVFFTPRPALGLLAACILTFSFFLKFSDCNEVPVVCDLLPPRVRSTAFGLMNTAKTLAGGIAVMVAGVLKSSHGLGPVFGAISGTTLLAAAILLPCYLFFLKSDLARRSALGPA